MPFSGPDIHGTSGGIDNLAIPQIPADIRVAKGGSYVAFLVVNGPLTLRNRASIEQIVRTLGSRGEYGMALVVRNDGGVIDVATTDINFAAGISVTQVSPGVIAITIPNDGITDAMLQDDYVKTDELSTAINAALVSYASDTDVATALANQRHTMNTALSWTHTLTLNRLMKANPAVGGPDIATIPAGTRLHLSPTTQTISGIDWRWAFVENWGAGWFTYSSGGFTAI